MDRERSLFRLTLEGSEPQSIKILARQRDWLTLEIDGNIRDFVVFRSADQLVVEDAEGNSSSFQVVDQRRLPSGGSKKPEFEGSFSLKAQMPGKVIRVLKQPGEQVEAGEGLVIIESMKMQNELKSPKSGRVRSCGVRDGENVNAAQLLFKID